MKSSFWNTAPEVSLFFALGMIRMFGGAAIEGELGMDSVWLDGEQVEAVAFGIVDDPIGEVWNFTTFDALMGLGYPSLADLTTEMPMMQMYSQGIISDLSYSFFIPYETQGYLVLGGVDYTLNSTPFTYHSVILPTYWLIQLDFLLIRDPNTGKILFQTNLDILGIVDTGTSFLAASPGILKEILRFLPQTNCIETGPSLSFVIQGVEYEVPDSKNTSLYLQVEDEKGNIMCIPSLSEMEFGEPFGNVILMGETYLNLFYTHFDMQNLRVGFAKMKL
jgi:hypothetical protein